MTYSLENWHGTSGGSWGSQIPRAGGGIAAAQQSPALNLQSAHHKPEDCPSSSPRWARVNLLPNFPHEGICVMNTNKRPSQTLSPAEKSIRALSYSGRLITTEMQVLSFLTYSMLHSWSLEPSSEPWEICLEAQEPTNVCKGRNTMTEASISPGRAGCSQCTVAGIDTCWAPVPVEQLHSTHVSYIHT